MSKDWTPRIVGGGDAPRRWVSPGELVLMALAGIALGLGLAGSDLPARWAADESAGATEFSAGGPADKPGGEAKRPADEARGEIGRPAAVRVIDGDTFVHDGVRIRIADIDTPEVDGRCAYESALAARATRRIRTLLAAGPFELRPNPDGRDEDRYGRKLRIVARDGRSLGDMLVAEGLARRWTGRRRPWC